jgi:hypothetical protein
MPEGAWARVGRHTESGRYGAEDWLTIYAEHLEVHAAQIEANVTAWRGGARPRYLTGVTQTYQPPKSGVIWMARPLGPL